MAVRAAAAATVCLLASAFPAIAQLDVNKVIAQCASMVGDLTRLGCYDELAKELNLDGPKAAPVETAGDVGKWRVSKETNPIDDTSTVTLSLTAESGSSRYGTPVLFYARCKSNKTEAFIVWHDYLGDDSRSVYEEWKLVTVRIGDDRATEEQWTVSTDSQATFAPAWAGDLLKRMATASTLVAQVTPYNESPVTAVFETGGLRAAAQPLAETCGWEFD